MSLIAEQQEVSQSDIARRLGIERSGMVKLIDQLEAKGYLQRHHGKLPIGQSVECRILFIILIDHHIGTLESVADYVLQAKGRRFGFGFFGHRDCLNGGLIAGKIFHFLVGLGKLAHALMTSPLPA